LILRRITVMETLSRIGSEDDSQKPATDLQTIIDRRRKVAAATAENCRLSGAVATVHRCIPATALRLAATALRLAATAHRRTATALRLSHGEGAVDMGIGRRLTEGWSATM
jgi:hypothetical protein